MGRYKLVVCPNCETPWIVNGNPKLTSCKSCSKQHKLKQLKIRGEFDESSQAREAIAYLRAVLNDEQENFEELKEEGVFRDDIIDQVSVVETQEYLEEKGVSEENIEKLTTDTEKLSQNELKKSILQVIQESQHPLSREEIVSEFEEQQEMAEKLLKRLNETGRIIKTTDGYTLV